MLILKYFKNRGNNIFFPRFKKNFIIVILSRGEIFFNGILKLRNFSYLRNGTLYILKTRGSKKNPFFFLFLTSANGIFQLEFLSFYIYISFFGLEDSGRSWKRNKGREKFFEGKGAHLVSSKLRVIKHGTRELSSFQKPHQITRGVYVNSRTYEKRDQRSSFPFARCRDTLALPSIFKGPFCVDNVNKLVN